MRIDRPFKSTMHLGCIMCNPPEATFVGQRGEPVGSAPVFRERACVRQAAEEEHLKQLALREQEVKEVRPAACRVPPAGRPPGPRGARARAAAGSVYEGFAHEFFLYENSPVLPPSTKRRIHTE